MIDFDRSICRDLPQALRREWLETNGLGGFAASTIAGLNTRRYHGLLVAATKPPVGRMLLLSKLEETLTVDGVRYELSANRYPGVVHPQGYQHLVRFRLDPFPVFTYEAGGVALEKTVFLVHGENTVVVRYSLAERTNRKVTLDLRPLLAFRDYHSTTHENSAPDRRFASAPGRVAVTPYGGLPTLHFAHNGGCTTETGDWYRIFEYDAERERGLDYMEDLFNPFALSFELSPGNDAVVIASTEERDAATAPAYELAERKRRARIAAGDDEFTRQLHAAAGQYIVRRGDQQTIIAGYHWFADWGRDTMIALPGLTLATGQYDVARSILREFARHVDGGMLPNRFPDAGEAPEYNTVDATLWFFEAIRKYLEYTGDLELVRRELYPVLTSIMEWHFRGTRHGIRVDDDGLLACGEPGVQLTWMDAKIGDWVVTPRYGKPVEIQALWHNALMFMSDLTCRLGCGPDAERYAEIAALARASFAEKFWNAERRCLFDVVNGAELDAAVRPNQIFAVSMPYALLPPAKERAVVDCVERELLTPYGLRSLERGHPQYRPEYKGDARARDSAYHQGTVWPWLMGPFVTAYLKVHERSDQAVRQAQSWLGAFEQHLREAGLGQVSEVFSAEPPHAPGGCVAQAWSVAELLRVRAEELASAGQQAADVAGIAAD